MEIVKDAVRRVSAGIKLPEHQNTVLALEPEALDAVRFLTHCTVRRAYATVERSYVEDGSVTPLVLVKAELSLKGKVGGPSRRTVVVGLAPYLVQILMSLKWPGDWARSLHALVEPSLAKRASELHGEIQKTVDALKGDQGAVSAIQDKARAMVLKEREKRRSELRDTFVVLLKHGWTEEDVVKTWREATCKEVHES